MSNPRFRPAPLALAIAVFAASHALVPQAHAQALAAPVAIALPAQPLGSALNELARQARLQLMVAPELVAGKNAPAVSGTLTVREALDRLLSGSGLVATVDGSEVIVRRGLASGQETTLPAVKVTGQAGGDATSEGTASYGARAASLLKGSDSLKEIPQSVTVMTRQRIDDQKLLTVGDILMQTPGISKSVSFAGNHVYLSRGFDIRNYQVDGMPMGYRAQGGPGVAADTAMYDRIEVLRGAPGLLLGNGDPSGTVNMVRKRPLEEKQVDVTLQAGSWNNFRAEVDATGPLNESRTLRGRLVASYQDREYFYDISHSQQPFIYGVLEYDLTPQTTLAAGYRHQEYTLDGPDTLGVLPRSSDGSDLGLSRSTAIGPKWGESKKRVDEVFADVRHRFNERWTATVSASYQESAWDGVSMLYNGTINPATGTGAFIYPYIGSDSYANTGLDANVTGRFDWFGREHKLMFGANRLVERSNGKSWNGFADRIALDLSNPNQVGWSEPTGYTRTISSDKTTSEGIYGNIHLQVADSWKVIAGGRVSWYEYKSRTNGVNAAPITQDHEFSPYAAVLYDINPQWTLYGSYADIFKPQSSYKTADGKALDPAVGSNYELGIKGSLFNDKLNTSFALFHIIQDNRYQVDPDYPTACPASPTGGSCYVNGGKVESKGLEAELNGQILPGWEAQFGYTYNEQTYLRDRDSTGNASSNEGKKFSGSTPRHIFRAYSSYRLPGEWSRLTLGGGVSAQSGLSYSNSAGVTWSQKGYAVWNAFARYQIDPVWSVALNVNNLFDRSHYVDNANQVYGEPRAALLTLRGHF